METPPASSSTRPGTPGLDVFKIAGRSISGFLHSFKTGDLRQPRQPFTCHPCGLDWAQLPLLRAPPGRFKSEQKVLSCFEFFFTQGTPQLLTRALQLIREKLKKEKIVHVKLLSGKIKRVEHYELTKASLGYLIDLLASLDLSPHNLKI